VAETGPKGIRGKGVNFKLTKAFKSQRSYHHPYSASSTSSSITRLTLLPCTLDAHRELSTLPTYYPELILSALRPHKLSRMPPKKRVATDDKAAATLADERERQKMLIQERSKIAMERLERDKIKMQTIVPPKEECVASSAPPKRKRIGVEGGVEPAAEPPTPSKKVRQKISKPVEGDFSDTCGSNSIPSSQGAKGAKSAAMVEDEVDDSNFARDDARVIPPPAPRVFPCRQPVEIDATLPVHSQQPVYIRSTDVPLPARSYNSILEADSRPSVRPSNSFESAQAPDRRLASTSDQRRPPNASPRRLPPPLPQRTHRFSAADFGGSAAASDDFDDDTPPQRQVGTFRPSLDHRPQGGGGSEHKATWATWSLRTQCMFFALLSFVVVASAWVGYRFYVAATPQGKVAALARMLQRSAGIAHCEGTSSIDDGRTMTLTGAVDRLQAEGESWAAVALMGPDDNVQGVLETFGITYDSITDRLVLGSGSDIIKPTMCWFMEDVIGAIQRGASLGFVHLLQLAAVRWDVSLGVLLVLCVVFYRWNQVARSAVVQTMYDVALHALECNHGSAIPLEQLKQHVLDELYSGPFSVMGIRAGRAWPDVERRFDLDARVVVDANAETAEGRIMKSATWVSPLKRFASHRASSAGRPGRSPSVSGAVRRFEGGSALGEEQVFSPAVTLAPEEVFPGQVIMGSAPRVL
jgi:hypothetical protein